MAVKVGQMVPFNQPTASSEKFMLRGSGAGGSCPPRWRTVKKHHTINTTTITVVTFMIRSASSLDSWIPRVLRRQKYSVTTMATAAAVAPDGSRMAEPLRASTSFTRPAMYCPADTPLIGPVRT